jgi:hypothetical protein
MNVLPSQQQSAQLLDRREFTPCFGVGCQTRGNCSCYDAVEQAPGGVTTQATCLRGGAYPNYRPIARPCNGRHG